MNASLGEVGGEILALSLSAAQQSRRCVVEGSVGAVILLFPAEVTQRAAAADLFGRTVEDGRGIFLRQCARPRHAVVKLAQRRSGFGDLLAHGGVLLRAFIATKALAAQKARRNEQEQERRRKALIEQHKTRVRVHRQGKAQNAQRKPQRRAHAVAPRGHIHQHCRKGVGRRVDKTAAARAQIHAKADAQRRRDRKRAAALEGKEQHGKHREDAPRRKAVRRFKRGKGHQHAQQDKKRRIGVFVLPLVSRRKQRAGAHRAERGKQQRHQAACRLAHTVAQDVDKFDGEHHARRQKRQERALLIDLQIKKRIVRREDQNARGKGAQRVRKRQKQHRPRRRAGERAQSPQSRAACADHAQRERRIAAEHLRARKRAGKCKAQHAIDDLSRPLLASQQLDHLHSPSPPCALFFRGGDYCKRPGGKSLSGNGRAKKRTSLFKGTFLFFTI